MTIQDFKRHFVARDADAKLSDFANLTSNLVLAEVKFVEYHDLATNTWCIDIETDDANRVLSIVFDADKRFCRMHVVHCNGISNLAWSLMCATFAAQQFDFIELHHGDVVFPISDMDARKARNSDEN